MAKRPERRATIAAVWLVLAATSGRLVAAEDLRIYFIDVQGGAATLIVTPERETVLVDCGWPIEKEAVGPARIIEALKDAGRDRVDHLVLTHWHGDHAGGVAGLAERVEIGRFYDRGLPEDGIDAEFPIGPKPDDPIGAAYRKASRGRRAALKPGDRLPLKGEISALVLASSRKVIPPPADSRPNPRCETPQADPAPDDSENSWSVALRFRLGAFDFLDCGDLTWRVEKELVCPVDRIGPIDLFQVTHHGRLNSNHPTFLATIAPTVAVMNNGPNKGGEAETVHRIKALDSVQAFYQLHRNAKTRDEDNGDPALFANTDPKGGRFIRVVVAPDGATFAARIGVDGPERTFRSK